MIRLATARTTATKIWVFFKLAELLLKIGNSAGYKDGDIVDAWSDRAILCMHTEWLYRLNNRSTGGIGEPRTGQIALKWLDETYEFREWQISKHEVLRRYKDGREKVLTGPQYRWIIEGQEAVVVFAEYADDPRRKHMPDRVVAALHACKKLVIDATAECRGANRDWNLVSQGEDIRVVDFELLDKEQMDAQGWLRRRLSFHRHRIFKDGDRLTWHVGRQDRSWKVLHATWDTIEQLTSLHREMPTVQRTPYLGEELRHITLQHSKGSGWVQYFGADRTDRIGKTGQRVKAIVGGTQLRRMLQIVVDDFADAERDRLKTWGHVDWKNTLSLTNHEISQVADKTRRVDWRGHPGNPEDQRPVKIYDRSAIVQPGVLI